MDGSSLADLGHQLFGRRARLVVAAWTLSAAETFSQHEAVRGADLPQSNVREELDRLVAIGMLSDVPRGDGPGRRYYARVDHPAWEIIRVGVDVAALLDRSRNAVPGQKPVELADDQVHVLIAAGDPAPAVRPKKPTDEDGEAAPVVGTPTA